MHGKNFSIMLRLVVLNSLTQMLLASIIEMTILVLTLKSQVTILYTLHVILLKLKSMISIYCVLRLQTILEKICD